MFETTVLAILQGVAEFLPISSSGHLALAKHFFGMSEAGLRLDIFLHVGTLIAVFAFYAKIVGALIAGAFGKSEDLSPRAAWEYAGKIVLSAIPAGLVGILFKDQLEAAFASTRAVGCALIFTGVVLTATRFLPKGGKDVSWLRALAMGLAQAVAILPGVSRSGMTLAAARATKIEAKKSAEFSFLMSAPPIAGAALLELKDAFGAEAVAASGEVSWTLTLYGCLLAAVVGYLSLKLLVKSLEGRWFWLFGPYCLIAGLLAIACA